MDAGGINAPGIKDLVFVKALPGAADSKSGGIAIKAGDVIQARVVAASEGSIILNLGGTRIPASSNLALQPGEMISLMVVALNPGKVVLKQLSGDTKAPASPKYTKDALIDYLLKDTGFTGADMRRIAELVKDVRVDIGKDIAQLETVLARTLEGASKGEEPGLARLARALEEIAVTPADRHKVFAGIKAMVDALSHEASVAAYLEGAGSIEDIETLKLSLLKLYQSMQGHQQTPLSRDLSALSASVERMLDVLNAVEFLNLPVESQQGQFIYLPLPVRLGDCVQTADIRIYTKGSGEKAGATGAASFTIAFALDMPSLGKTRAWVEVVERFVNVSIAAENDRMLEEAKPLFDELKCSLEEMGYEVGRMTALEIRELREEAPKSLIEEKLGIRLEGIDFRV